MKAFCHQFFSFLNLWFFSCAHALESSLPNSYSCLSSVYGKSELISLISAVVDREVVRQEAERGRGDPVRDRPEAEASDRFGGRQRAAEASRLDHWVERGLWVKH